MTSNTEPAPVAAAVPDCCAPGRAAFMAQAPANDSGAPGADEMADADRG